jgi:hypothetical protein
MKATHMTQTFRELTETMRSQKLLETVSTGLTITGFCCRNRLLLPREMLD